MTFKKAFLPAGLVLAIAGTLTLPAPGVWMQEANMISVFVTLIFLVNGWEFKLAEARLNRKFFQSFAAVSVISLLVGPLLGLLGARLFSLDPLVAMGLIVISSVPVTLSSAIVMAEISAGNRAWALIMTIGLNLLGIFTLPYMVKLMLEQAEDFDISATQLLFKLLTLVLLPFIAGIVLRRIFRKVHSPVAMQYLPSTCVILTVYAAFAAARDMLGGLSWGSYPLIAFICLGVHLGLMVLGLCTAQLLHLQRPERNTLLFIASQKTLPLALSVLVVIAPENALGLIPCLLFHFIQLFLDSFIASHLSPRAHRHS